MLTYFFRSAPVIQMYKDGLPTVFTECHILKRRAGSVQLGPGSGCPSEPTANGVLGMRPKINQKLKKDVILVRARNTDVLWPRAGARAGGPSLRTNSQRRF